MKQWNGTGPYEILKSRWLWKLPSAKSYTRCILKSTNLRNEESKDITSSCIERIKRGKAQLRFCKKWKSLQKKRLKLTLSRQTASSFEVVYAEAEDDPSIGSEV